ncbi:hypothetical protein RJT34_24370 [Clitoria ternatea]|uniref:Uncharacterized protein n=1 Tax=Clitoria ternatea TaxID=43366 RepID=A0AAN9IHF3_CLITE
MTLVGADSLLGSEAGVIKMVVLVVAQSTVSVLYVVVITLPKTVKKKMMSCASIAMGEGIFALTAHCCDDRMLMHPVEIDVW